MFCYSFVESHFLIASFLSNSLKDSMADSYTDTRMANR